MQLKTITICIYNSDDKLSQNEWSQFIGSLYLIIVQHTLDNNIYFRGGSSIENPFQNYCYVFKIKEENIGSFQSELKALRIRYKQDSIALVIGDTLFI